MQTKIGIDSRMMSSSFGIGRYIQQLTKHLEQIAPEEMEFFLFMRENNWEEFVPERDNFNKIKADIDWYGLEEQLKLPRKINQVDLDLIHFPHWNIPLFYQGDFVVTIHDLIMFHFPRPEATTRSKLTYWFKDKVHRYLVKKAVKNSKHIITTSNFTKNDIMETFKTKEDKVSVTYQAPFENNNDYTSFVEIEANYDLQRPYVFYVGSAYPHKNLDNLLKAWQQFQRQGDTRSNFNQNKYQLVLAGKKNYFYDRLIKSDLYQNNTNINYIGEVTDSELKTLYKQAELFIFPSLYEGFGLPPLEALQENTPVLASRKTSIPEVLGKAAEFTDATNPEQFAKDLRKVLSKEKLQQKTLSNAEQLLSTYSWKQLAQKTLKIYKKAL